MNQVTLTRKQKEAVRSAISREITQNYGSFYEMEPERVDMLYTFLGIANMAPKGIPEHLETSNPANCHTATTRDAPNFIHLDKE